MRILLVDDHQILLDSLSLLISTIPDTQIVGQLNDSRLVADFLEDHEVDMVMTDMTMPYLTGIEVIAMISQQFPKVKTLMLTVSEDAAIIKEAFGAGASGYIMKKSGRAEIAKALQTIAKGEKYFSEAVINELLNVQPKVQTISTDTKLTIREIDIIKLIAAEYSTQAIADKLFISTGTVESHRHNIFKKLNVKTSIGIIKYAVKHRLLE